MTAAARTLVQALESEGLDVGEQSGVPLVSPTDTEAVASVLARAARERLRVVPIGLGTRLAYTRPEVLAGEGDLLLSTRRLTDVVAYEPGDGTLTALAGARMADLARHVHTGGHRLTPDVAHPERSTLGGVLGSGSSGLDRARFGPARHHVLGARAVLADGTLAKSGGRLVKNVTGFDLHRLWCGSRGTLGVIVEASLRLFPQPDAELALSATFDDPRRALDLAGNLEEHIPTLPGYHATLVEGPDDDGTFRLSVFLSGRAPAVAVGRERATGLMPDAKIHEDSAARERFAEARDRIAPDGVFPSLRLTSLPSQAAGALETARSFLDRRGLAAHFRVERSVALCDVHLVHGIPEEPSALAALLADLAERLAPAEVALEPRVVPADAHAALARTAPGPAPGATWMHRLRERYDPDGLFRSSLYPPPIA